MDDLLGEALAALTADLRTVLPTPANSSHEPTVFVTPRSVSPTGLGGYVGPHTDPDGDVLGRRLSASVEVGVRAQTPGDLPDALSAVSSALLTVTPGDTANGDVLRVVHGDGPPASSNTTRTLHFDVVYEFVRRPTVGGGLISEVLLDLDPGTTPLGRAVRVRAAPGVLTRFDVVDDPLAVHHRPSDWDVDPSEPVIVQRAETWGGATGTGVSMPGTALVLRATPSTPAVSDLLLRTAFTADSGGVGLVWRWQGPDDFYYVLLDVDRELRRIGRKVDGEFAELDVAAVDTTTGYEPGPHHLKVRIEGTAMAASLDGKEILAGTDAAIVDPGRVGLLTRRTATARFTGLEYVPLEGGTLDD